MKRTTLFLIPVCLMLFTISVFNACKQRELNLTDPNKNPNNSINTLSAFYEANGPKKQTISFKASELPKTLSLSGGTKIFINSGTFTIGGLPVTGTIKVEVTEVLKRSDMLLTGTNTDYYYAGTSYVLESGGFLNIRATADGQKVDDMLKSYIGISMPSNNRQGYYNLYAGTMSDSGGNFYWRPPMDSTGGIGNDSAYFNFKWGRLGWVNVDKWPYFQGQKATLKVKIALPADLPEELAKQFGKTGYVVIAFIPKGYNIVTAITESDTDPHTYKSSFDMPVNMDGRIFAYAIKDGQYYMAQKDIKITAGNTESVTVTKCSIDDIQNAIKAMDGY